jgi:DNA-binding NarL/FixJ family response regulator
VIRILIVDDHPALQAGLLAVLRSEPGLVPVGTASGEFDMWPAIQRSRPDVVLLDYHLPPSDGLQLCRRLKRLVHAPAVVLFSAYADSRLVVAAMLAGADGLINKATPALELYDAIRTVAGGDTVMPAIGPAAHEAAAQALEPDDLSILGMALDGVPRDEIARVLRLAPETLSDRLDAMIARLRVEVPLAAFDT